MSLPLKLASALCTLALAGGAIAIGGGTPLSPGAIADATEQAAANAGAAADATGMAARRTRALAVIAGNVGEQVDTSHRLLRIQLEIESASEESARRGRDLARAVGTIRRALDDLEGRLQRLSCLSERSSRVSEQSADGASRLDRALGRLIAVFDEVVDESRELNRKARGLEDLVGGPR